MSKMNQSYKKYSKQQILQEIYDHTINQKKQERILKTSKRFLLNHREYNDKFVRFDVIFVDMDGVEPVYHIESAFLE